MLDQHEILRVIARAIETSNEQHPSGKLGTQHNLGRYRAPSDSASFAYDVLAALQSAGFHISRKTTGKA